MFSNNTASNTRRTLNPKTSRTVKKPAPTYQNTRGELCIATFLFIFIFSTRIATFSGTLCRRQACDWHCCTLQSGWKFNERDVIRPAVPESRAVCSLDVVIARDRGLSERSIGRWLWLGHWFFVRKICIMHGKWHFFLNDEEWSMYKYMRLKQWLSSCVQDRLRGVVMQAGD